MPRETDGARTEPSIEEHLESMGGGREAASETGCGHRDRRVYRGSQTITAASTKGSRA